MANGVRNTAGAPTGSAIGDFVGYDSQISKSGPDPTVLPLDIRHGGGSASNSGFLSRLRLNQAAAHIG